MKKGLKITLITLASIIGTAAVLSCTVGGMPFKAYAEQNFEFINETAGEYPYYKYKTPDGWQTVTARGVSVQLPPDFKQAGDTGLKRFQYQLEDRSEMVWFMLPTDFEEMNLADPQAADDVKSKITAMLVREYADEHDCPLSDWYSYYNLIYQMKLDDCNVHSLRKGAEFALLGYLKEETAFLGAEIWNWHTADGDGFVSRMGNGPDEPEGRCKVFASIFANDERNVVYEIMVRTNSAERTAQIVNSMRLTGEHYDPASETEESSTQEDLQEGI